MTRAKEYLTIAVRDEYGGSGRVIHAARAIGCDQDGGFFGSKLVRMGTELFEEVCCLAASKDQNHVATAPKIRDKHILIAESLGGNVAK